MSGTRSALLFSSIGRYFAIITGIISTFVAARLMTPAEFGVSVVGTAVFAIGEAVRQLGSTQYLVQEKDLDALKIRTSFTISLIVTLLLSLGIFLFAGDIAASYGFAGLAPFLLLQTIGFLTGPFVQPIYGLLTREGRFRRIAIIDISTATLNAAVMIALVASGFSYMGIAWGAVAAAVLSMIMTLASHRDFSVLIPSLREWRRVVTFGIYGSAVALIYKCTESVWYLVAGRQMDARSVGLLQRAGLLATFPDRVLLAGVGAVALRNFSEIAHRGEDVAPSYLKWISFATALLWPSLAMIGLLAPHVIGFLLGPQWVDAVPILQILAFSMCFVFPLTLNYAAQIATGGMRFMPLVALSQALVSVPVIYFASRYGLLVVAISNIIPNAVAGVFSTVIARRFVRFSWRAFFGAVAPSAVLALATAIGPLALILLGWSLPHFAMLMFGGALGALGWLAAVHVLRHPVRDELERLVSAGIRRLRREA